MLQKSGGQAWPLEYKLLNYKEAHFFQHLHLYDRIHFDFYHVYLEIYALERSQKSFKKFILNVEVLLLKYSAAMILGW